MERAEQGSGVQNGARAPGDKEYEFLLPFPTPQSMANAPRAAVVSDEKIYVADVEPGANGSTLFVARTTRSGDVDGDFGRDGWIADYIEIGEGRVIGLLPRDNGGVLAVMSGAVREDFDVALVCFTEAGTLDPNFGDRGRIVHHIPLPESSNGSVPSNKASDVAERGQTAGSGGSVVAVDDGTFYCLLGQWSGAFYALIRFQADGQLDARFNGTGFVTDGERYYREWGASSLAVADDGRVTIVGRLFGLNLRPYSRLAVWRFTQDGALDRSFGDDGYALFYADAANLDPENLEQAYFSHVAALSDGGVVASGNVTTKSGTSYQNFGMLACLDASGRPLDTFNGGKFRLYGVIGNYQTDFRGGLAVEGEDRIVVGGIVSNSPITDSDLLVARFLPSGALDPTFANGGTKRFKPDDTRVNYMSDLLVDSNGKILVAGAGGPNNGVSSMKPFVFQLSGA